MIVKVRRILYLVAATVLIVATMAPKGRIFPALPFIP